MVIVLFVANPIDALGSLMKLLFALALTSTAFAAGPAPVAFESFTYTGRDTAFETPLPAGHFRNPILAGYCPDPSICRVGRATPVIGTTVATQLA